MKSPARPRRAASRSILPPELACVRLLFFVTVPQVLLLLVVLYLFIVVFRISLSSNRGQASIESMKAHLKALRQKFITHTPIDPEEERRVLEELQNRIKVTNTPEEIMKDAELRYLFVSNYNQVSEWPLDHGLKDTIPWTRLCNTMTGFYERYFVHLHPPHVVHHGSNEPTSGGWQATRPVGTSEIPRTARSSPRPLYYGRS